MSVEPFVEPFVALDHVQLAIPAGGDAAARRFYVELMGFVEVPRPADMAGRGEGAGS